MSAQHTPGPWTYKGEQMKHDSSRVIYDADSKPCAFAADFNQFKRDPECEANARLIAAAPELLAALKDCVLWVNVEDQGAPEYIAKWQSVIAKAEGR